MNELCYNLDVARVLYHDAECVVMCFYFVLCVVLCCVTLRLLDQHVLISIYLPGLIMMLSCDLYCRLQFGVGDNEVHEFRMIERHYFRGKVCD
jgi:hypothetical protein